VKIAHAVAGRTRPWAMRRGGCLQRGVDASLQKAMGLCECHNCRGLAGGLAGWLQAGSIIAVALALVRSHVLRAARQRRHKAGATSSSRSCQSRTAAAAADYEAG